ncbi:MAG: acyl-CoA thioesterase [Paracoccaceae bacterium]|nr:acyl-CoA thioesterase [Paracoccaceae bacterium]
MPEFDLTRHETFRHWTPVTIRYSDQDAMAHVNNTAIATYVESARTAFIYDLIQRGGVEGMEFILARMTIDYLAEFHYPGAVDVGARLIRFGTKSIGTGYGIFNGETCVATSECVNVFYDMGSRKTLVPPDSVREALEAELSA